MMDFIKELQWRGMLQDMVPGTEEHLRSGQRRGYIGFDPTAPSLTIGNYVQIMLLDLFQRCGHQPIVLMGGATGLIGDPSGKSQERELQSAEKVEENLMHQASQVRKFLNFDESDNKALLINNLDFYRNMTIIDFLRDIGKHLTVNYMLSKESVKQRLESGISFTEFSYQLIQGNDFLQLYRQEGCTIQMGGSDQWGNITAGTEFIRRNAPGAEVFAATTPLLTKTDGSKFGKSEQGNLWLDPELTSPYQFYQFWINSNDADLPRYIRYFSRKSKEEIEAMEMTHAENPRELKKLLAEEITARVHSNEAVQSVVKVTEIIFNPRADNAQLNGLTAAELGMVSREIPSFSLDRALLDNGIGLIDLMAEHTAISQSKGEARRAISSNAVSVNKEKKSDIEASVTRDDLLEGGYMMIENGKKNKFILKF